MSFKVECLNDLEAGVIQAVYDSLNDEGVIRAFMVHLVAGVILACTIHLEAGVIQACSITQGRGS